MSSSHPAVTRSQALEAVAEAARHVIDEGKLVEQGDFGTHVEVPLPVMARLIDACGTLRRTLDAAPPAASTAEAPLDDIARIYARDAKDEDGHPDHLAGIESVWCAGDAAGYARRGREVVERLLERAAENRALAQERHASGRMATGDTHISIAHALEAAAKEMG